MNNFLYLYQHLPFHIDPTAFSFGLFKVDWYSLMYLIGFSVIFLLLDYRIKKGEIDFDFNTSKLLDLLFFSFAGLLLGGRLGYVLFYNFSYYLTNPWAIISPFDPVTHTFIGIYGMSYHGGLIGVISFTWIFARRNNFNFFKIANFVVPAIPLGYFFGRLGNFLNGELYGRVTQKFWGMYFPTDSFGFLRHPSQLYEAILEGIVLFAILWIFRNRGKFQENLLGIYFLGYAFFRITVEFFRQPDPQIGFLFGFLTLGQILSLGILLLGIALIVYGKKIKKMLE